MNISTSGAATSYKVVAESICRHLGVSCKITEHGHNMFRNVDIFITHQSDLITYRTVAMRSKVVYITAEGRYVSSRDLETARSICRSRRCVVTTHFGRAIFEEMGIPVQDVVYHPLPYADRELVEYLRGVNRAFQVVYLNAKYRLNPSNEQCERKGWRFWPHVYKSFLAIGFISGDKEEDHAISIKTRNTEEIYKLLALGSVYANLSTQEGFGINPPMALYVGTKVVAWDTNVVNETLRGIEGVYFVPVRYHVDCTIPSMLFAFQGMGAFTLRLMWGDVEDFIQTVKYALATATTVDYAEVENRFGPHLAHKFAEMLR